MSAVLRRRVILFVCFVVGIGCVALAGAHILGELLGDVVKEVGVAFMIAAVLGSTIDTLLKIELVRDAFLVAFSYAFPSALKGEILRIMRYRLICDRHFLVVRIEKIDDDTVRVTCETNRKVRNMAPSSEKLRPYLHIDEWGFKQEPSKIMECRVDLEDGKSVVGRQQKTSGSTVLFEGPQVDLKPDKCATLRTKWCELRRSNDSIYITFDHPTIDPEIEVPPLDGFQNYSQLWVCK